MEKVQFILNHYPTDCRSEQRQFLGSAGGFSGAAFWKIFSPRGPLCLRKWPKEHPSRQRIEFIHGLLIHVAKSGLSVVPVPIGLQSDPKQTYLKSGEHFWELTPWMPGKANFRTQPSIEKLQSAARTLASFHQMSADFSSLAQPIETPSTIVQRLQQLKSWLYGDLDQLEKCLLQPRDTRTEAYARQGQCIVDYTKQQIGRIKIELNSLRDCKVPLQPCIRDVWEQHVLYCGDVVSGLIDFGAARPDTVATDLVRLLGSLVVDDRNMWQCGLETYESIRPLSSSERLLIGPLDRSAVLLAGLNWLRWIYLENRGFADREAVNARLEQSIIRLKNQAEGLY